MACIRDSLEKDEAPFASHGFYTQPGILDENKQRERILGIKAGFKWGQCAEIVAVYCDRGISAGMEGAIRYYQELDIPIEYRNVKGWTNE